MSGSLAIGAVREPDGKPATIRLRHAAGFLQAGHRADPHVAFWRNLKEGSDLFEVDREEPRVSVSSERCDAFGAGDPSGGAIVAQKATDDERKVLALIAKGTPAVRLVYDDGGQHQSFRQVMIAGEDGAAFVFPVTRPKPLGDVSRPEALASGPREVFVPASEKPSRK